MADRSRLGDFAPEEFDFASEILGGDPNFIQVQEGAAGARQQPSARVQNVPAPPRRAAPVPKAAPAAPMPSSPPDEDFAGQILGTPSRTPQSVQPRLARQKRDGDMRGAVQRYFEGYTDPKYANVPGFDYDNTDVNVLSSFGAKMFAPNDAAYSDIIKNQLGQNYIGTEHDMHGQPLVRYRDTAGQEQLRYVNRPGLDLQDVERGVFGAVPYALTGGVMGAVQKGAGLLANMAGQGVTAAATSMAGNTASRMLGSNQAPDMLQTGIIGAAGAAGPLIGRPVGALDRNIRQIPGLVDRNGTLTARGVAAAQEAGLDPATLGAQAAREFAETYAKSGSAAEAAIRGSTAEFGIPVSRGQMTKDPNQLLLEKSYRTNLSGREAADVMKRFDQEQADAIANAALGDPAGKTGIAPMLAPTRTRVDQATDLLGESIQQGARDARKAGKAEVGAKFKEAGDAIAPPEALAELPKALQSRIGNFPVNRELHPTAAAMDAQIAAFIEGKVLDPGMKVLSTRSTPGVDEFRKQLYALYQGAAPGADRTAAGLVYKGYDDWLGQVSEKAMLGGDAAFAAKIRTARTAHRSLMETFAPTADGKKLPAANVLSKLIRPGTSAEEVVTTLFGAQGLKSAPKEGSLQALESLKKALNTWGDGAKGARSQTWDDIRLAYWTRLVQDKQGNVLTPQVMLNNIQNVLSKQNSVMRTLYSDEERGAMIRFATALRAAAWKDPNPSGTATALAGLTKDFSNTIIRALGWQGSGVLGLVGSSVLVPLRNIAAGQGAKRAVQPGTIRIVDPNIAPVITSGSQGLLRTDLGGQ